MRHCTAFVTNPTSMRVDCARVFGAMAQLEWRCVKLEEIRSKGFAKISVYELFGCIGSVVLSAPVFELQLFLIKNKFMIGFGGRDDIFDRELLMAVVTGSEVC